MDLDNFDRAAEVRPVAASEAKSSAKGAVDFIDSQWYNIASRRARWMDLIGDYAGNELFLIDGEALFQLVLNDHLLALGRDNDPSFQILHALHSLESALEKFQSRSAVFEIAFWRSGRHLTMHTGSSNFTFASRALARALLFKHLAKLDIVVHTFEDLSDPRWFEYLAREKPMFVMTDDGGVIGEGPDFLFAECTLTQRVFMFDLLAQGVSVTLLRGAEFHDSKILSFVFEQRFDTGARQRLSSKLWAASVVALKSLETTEDHARRGVQMVSWTTSAPQVLQSMFEQEASIKALIQRILKEPSLEGAFIHELLYAFVAHLLVLPSLSVEVRARALYPLHHVVTSLLLESFLPRAFSIMESTLSGASADLDGRVFVSLIGFLSENPEASRAQCLGPVSVKLETIWGSLALPQVDYAAFAARFPPAPRTSNTVALRAPAAMRLLPFEHPIFDRHLASIRVDIETEDDLYEAASNLEFNTPFADTHHWHNHRRAILPAHLGGEDPQPLDERKRWKQLRSQQRFMAKLQEQAETLTGAFGLPLRQMVIPVVGLQKAKASSSAKPRAIQEKNPSKANKKEHVSSADKIRQANAAKKQVKQDDSNEVWWKDQLKMTKDRSTENTIAFIENLMRNKRTWGGWLAVEIRLYRMHLEFELWHEQPDREDAAVRDRFTVSILRLIKDIRERQGLFPVAAAKLDTALVALGFSDYIPSADTSQSGLSASSDSDVRNELLFKFKKLLSSKTGSPLHAYTRIVEDPEQWQLRLFGEFMDRSMDSQWDSRVTFHPDAWQRTVLDCLDKNMSVLVVAPTSAGKTFISYYAMEQVLRGSDDGILVYVAPTKALVSQIAAEVYARFSKDLNGRSCWAIHTRDYRVHNPQNCQILVTVPEMLAIMLLSPPLARVWTPRIKYIILDEIHTIGQQEGGAVWEQIILFSPCPIIGLSATIGHPERFNTWLESVQTAHGYKHAFIHHPHRYSHLRKHTYALDVKAPTSFRGLDNYSNTDRLRFVHPISMLSFGARSLPPDFSLEAADCLSLYRALRSYRAKIPADLDALEPSKFFADIHGSWLKQKDILRYEAALLAILKQLLDTSDPQDPSSVLHNITSDLTDPVLAEVDHQYLPSRDDFFKNFKFLVSDLHSTGDLPAIFFQFDRKVCETMAQKLLKDLEDAEKEWRRTSPEWTKKLADWERWKAQARVRERQLEKLKKQKKDPNERENVEIDTSWERSFDPSEPSSQFSFAGISTAYSKSDLEEELRSLSRWGAVPPWALKALQRGIGVHHAGMNKHYRSSVESLFRMGFIRVVIATGTLALGINAPTRTSVFCGDSPFLTALMYRQCSGRAGRRGYDLLGKVVFYGLAIQRSQRLVLSRLPSLGGNFPMTSTMVLRLFSLLQGSDNAPVAQDAIRSLLELPHVSFTSDAGRLQLLHHIRFSIDYLRRSGLLDRAGIPINLFGIASHLYYTEPSNLALIALLRHGILHRICGQSSDVNARRDLLILMCHLFGRRYLPKSYASQENLKHLLEKCPSIVVLPPLPSNARKVLMRHDDEIRDVFAGYAIVYASQHAAELGDDNQLPLSGMDFSRTDDGTDTLFHQHLRDSALRVVARSPFVANSGHSDDFRTVEDLARTTRRGLHLNEHAIPSMQRITALPGGGDEHFALNAYLLDFYTHGQVAALVKANGIRLGEIWYLLQDFTLTLKVIRAGLGQLLAQASQSGDAESEAADLDSGYGTFDPAEADGDNDDTNEGSMKRPPGVSDKDWRLYQILDGVTNEFDERFRAMWA